MANIRHAKVSAIPDDQDSVDAGEVVPSDWNAAHSVTLVDGDIPASIARDTEVTAAVAAEATLARNADNLSSGTVADARIASTIARDSEVTSAVGAEATARDAAIETHRADTTNVHGITDTANVVLTGDARLSDARTPTGAAGGDLGGTYPNPSVTDDSHSHTAATLPAAGADLSGINFLVGTASALLSAEIAVGTTPGGELGGTWASPTVDATHSGSTHAAAQAAAEATAAADATTKANAAQAAAIAASVPTARTVTAGSGLTGGGDLSANRTLAADFGTGAGKVTQGNDSRLSDARTPTAHKTSHENGGADEISVAGLSGELADAQPPKAHAASHSDGGADEVHVTDLAGYPGGGTTFLRDDGAFAAPPGGGSGNAVDIAVDPDIYDPGEVDQNVQAVLEHLVELVEGKADVPVAASNVSVTGVAGTIAADLQAMLDAILAAEGWSWDAENLRWNQLGLGHITLSADANDETVEDGAGPLLTGSGSAFGAVAGHSLDIIGGRSETPDGPPGPPTGAGDLNLRGGRSRGSEAGGDVILWTSRAGDANTITGEVIKAGSSSADEEIAGTLAAGAVFHDTAVTVTDSSGTPQQVFFVAGGVVVGDVGAGGTNTWDILTGDYSFSFAGASTGPVTADYVSDARNELVETLRVRAVDGVVVLNPAELPTTDPAIEGALWNDGSFLRVSAG